MKRLAPLLLSVLAGSAQAGFETMMNPLFNPYNPGQTGLPLGALMNPLGGAGPLLVGAPLVGLGGLGMMGWGGMYPMLQMAPNMMSYSHLNQMANPYLGGPFAGNPYLSQSMPIPLVPPAFSPSLPSMPFSPAQGMVPFALPQGMSPFAAPQPAAPMFFPVMPGAVQPQAFQPGFPLAFPALPQEAPPPQAGNPYLSTAPAPVPAKPLSPFAAPVQPEAKPAPATPPLDPAAFMQMYMQPQGPGAR